MKRSAALLNRLQAGPPVLMDGAMSTALSDMGYVFNAVEWLRVNVDSPSHVAEVHASYAKAGAQLHIANSFATAKHVLEAADQGHDFERINRAAIAVCRKAATSASSLDQWVAGSLSTYAAGHDRRNLPGATVLVENVAAQANILANAGADMLALEMVADVDTGIAMIRGAAVAGIPVSLGLVCGLDEAGVVSLQHRSIGATWLDDALPRMLDAAPPDMALIVTIMHTDIAHTLPALRIVRRHFDGLVGAYPHTGRYAPPGGWDTSEGCTETEFADVCEEALEVGVSFVGGCCGIGAAHIETLGRRLVGVAET